MGRAGPNAQDRDLAGDLGSDDERPDEDLGTGVHRTPTRNPVQRWRDDLEVGFLTTLTVFSAPLNVTLEELRIESYFPANEATEQTIQMLDQLLP